MNDKEQIQTLEIDNKNLRILVKELKRQNKQLKAKLQELGVTDYETNDIEEFEKLIEYYENKYNE